MRQLYIFICSAFYLLSYIYPAISTRIYFELAVLVNVNVAKNVLDVRIPIAILFKFAIYINVNVDELQT